MANAYDILCDQGALLTRSFSLLTASGIATPLAGFSARMQLRSRPLESMTLELSTSNGRLVLNDTLGLVMIRLPGAVTSVVPAGKFDYDLFVYDPTGEATKLVYGTFNLRAQITKPLPPPVISIIGSMSLDMSQPLSVAFAALL